MLSSPTQWEGRKRWSTKGKIYLGDEVAQWAENRLKRQKIISDRS
jgi:hypothetical protein